jgi:hypothetical protein
MQGISKLAKGNICDKLFGQNGKGAGKFVNSAHWGLAVPEIDGLMRAEEPSNRQWRPTGLFHNFEKSFREEFSRPGEINHVAQNE